MKYSDKLSFLMYVDNYRTYDLAKQLRVKVNTLDTWLFFINRKIDSLQYGWRYFS